jgi:hypothetical protein
MIELLLVHGNAFQAGYAIDIDICRITMHRKLIVAFRGDTFTLPLLSTETNVVRQYAQKESSRIHVNSD